MSEQNKPFVVTERRKFTMDGDLRPDADPSPEKEKRQPFPVDSATDAVPRPVPVAQEPASGHTPEPASENALPPAPTDEHNEQARVADQLTADPPDTAIRAPNPPTDQPPAMSCEQHVT